VWVDLCRSAIKNQADSIRLAKAGNDTIFLRAISKFPVEKFLNGGRNKLSEDIAEE
jgi:hypothetical protein